MEGNSIRLRQRPRRYTSFPTPAVEVAPLIWQHAIIECIRKRIVPPHRELLSPGATFDHLSHPHLFAQMFVYPGSRAKQTDNGEEEGIQDSPICHVEWGFAQRLLHRVNCLPIDFDSGKPSAKYANVFGIIKWKSIAQATQKQATWYFTKSTVAAKHLTCMFTSKLLIPKECMNEKPYWLSSYKLCFIHVFIRLYIGHKNNK